MNSHHSALALAVEQQVGVVAGELREARAVPHLLEERQPLLRRSRRRRRGRAAGWRNPLTDVFSISRIASKSARSSRLLLGVIGAVVERRAPVGGALVHGERRDLVGDGRDHLHAARAGADRRRRACRRSRPASPATARCGTDSPRKSSRPGTSGKYGTDRTPVAATRNRARSSRAVAGRDRSTCPTARRRRPR